MLFLELSWSGGAVDCTLTLSAEKHANELAAAVRGHENKIALLLLRHDENGVGREIAGHVDAVAGDARLRSTALTISIETITPNPSARTNATSEKVGMVIPNDSRTASN